MLKELIESGKTNFDEVETAMYNMRSKISALEKEVNELKELHYLDQAEIVRLRRQIEAEHEPS